MRMTPDECCAALGDLLDRNGRINGGTVEIDFASHTEALKVSIQARRALSDMRAVCAGDAQ